MHFPFKIKVKVCCNNCSVVDIVNFSSNSHPLSRSVCAGVSRATSSKKLFVCPADADLDLLPLQKTASVSAVARRWRRRLQSAVLQRNLTTRPCSSSSSSSSVQLSRRVAWTCRCPQRCTVRPHTHPCTTKVRTSSQYCKQLSWYFIKCVACLLCSPSCKSSKAFLL